MKLYPGADVACSVIPPIPTEWWLRPVRSAWRVGEHNAVVWKRLYFSPFAARRSAVGVAHGPPNALAAPNPTSSSKTTSTFGASGGGRSGSIAANDVSGSLASYVISPANRRSGIGNTSRPACRFCVIPLSLSLGRRREDRRIECSEANRQTDQLTSPEPDEGQRDRREATSPRET